MLIIDTSRSSEPRNAPKNNPTMSTSTLLHYYFIVLNFLRAACSVIPCPLPVTPTFPSRPSGEAKMLPFFSDTAAMLPLAFFLPPLVWNACQDACLLFTTASFCLSLNRPCGWGEMGWGTGTGNAGDRLEGRDNIMYQTRQAPQQGVGGKGGARAINPTRRFINPGYNAARQQPS